MKKGTMFYSEHKDGGITLGYEDCNVECFGGCDYEATYNLSKESTDQFRAILAKDHSGTLEQMIIEVFGIHLDKESLSQWFDKHNIKYDLFTWIS